MSKPVEYKEVVSKNGVVRQVPSKYHKPFGRRKTISVSLPTIVVDNVKQIALAETNHNKSLAYETLILEALANRGIHVNE